MCQRPSKTANQDRQLFQMAAFGKQGGTKQIQYILWVFSQRPPSASQRPPFKAAKSLCWGGRSMKEGEKFKKFEPKPDITAHELATILQLAQLEFAFGTDANVYTAGCVQFGTDANA
jgi:hypothetical protein